MQQLVDLFGFLSVVLRAATLVFQSLLLGGVVFLLWVARDTPGTAQQIAKLRSSAWRLFRASVIGLAIAQVLYLYVNSAVLMATAEIPFREVIGANFFISGSIVLAATAIIGVLAREGSRVSRWLLPVGVAIVLASLGDDQPCRVAHGRPPLADRALAGA